MHNKPGKAVRRKSCGNKERGLAMRGLEGAWKDGCVDGGWGAEGGAGGGVGGGEVGGGGGGAQAGKAGEGAEEDAEEGGVAGGGPAPPLARGRRGRRRRRVTGRRLAAARGRWGDLAGP